MDEAPGRSKYHFKNTLLMLAGGVLIGLGIGLAVLWGLGILDEIIYDYSYRQAVSDAPQSGFSHVMTGDLAPEFVLQNLQDQDVLLSSQRGKVVLLNFWATWCGPCRLEMPAFESAYREWEDDFIVLAINFDEPRPEVQAFVQELDLSFPVLLDPGAEIQRLYQVRGYPTSLMLDRDGRILAVHIGIMSENQLAGYLSMAGLTK